MLTENYRNRLQKLAGIVEEGKTHKNIYGALMVKVEHPTWKSEILSMIDKEDIYDKPDFGLEVEPHVTVLFGFHKNADFDKIKELVKDQGYSEIKFKNLDELFDKFKTELYIINAPVLAVDDLYYDAPCLFDGDLVRVDITELFENYMDG